MVLISSTAWCPLHDRRSGSSLSHLSRAPAQRCRTRALVLMPLHVASNLSNRPSRSSSPLSPLPPARLLPLFFLPNALLFMALNSPLPRRASTALTTATRLPAAVARTAAARFSTARPARPPPTAADEAIAAVAAAAATAVAAGVGVWGAEAVPSEAGGGGGAADGAGWDPWVWRRYWRGWGESRWRGGGGGAKPYATAGGGGGKRRGRRGRGGGRVAADGWPPVAAAEAAVVEHPAWRWGWTTASWAGKKQRDGDGDMQPSPVAREPSELREEKDVGGGGVGGRPMRVGLLQLGRRAPPPARLWANNVAPVPGEASITTRGQEVTTSTAVAVTTEAATAVPEVADTFTAVPRRAVDTGGHAAAPRPEPRPSLAHRPDSAAALDAAPRITLRASPTHSCELPPHYHHRRGERAERRRKAG